MKTIFDRFKRLFKMLTAGVALASLLVIVSVSATDATFSAAPSSVTAAAPVAPSSAPVVAQAAPPPDSAWADRILAFLTSTPFLAGFAYVVIRLESTLQGKTKINLQKATGAAHSVFNLLFDIGVIKTGRFRDAEEQFFTEFDKQFFNAYGHAPDDVAQDAAHATFTQLFTAHTDDTVPAPQTPV